MKKLFLELSISKEFAEDFSKNNEAKLFLGSLIAGATEKQLKDKKRMIKNGNDSVKITIEVETVKEN